MTPPGPSRKIIVKPIERPVRTEPEHEPAKPSTSLRQNGSHSASANRVGANASQHRLNVMSGTDPPLIAGKIHGLRVWNVSWKGGMLALTGQAQQVPWRANLPSKIIGGMWRLVGPLARGVSAQVVDRVPPRPCRSNVARIDVYPNLAARQLNKRKPAVSSGSSQ